jgi:DNA polymerase delta subunit 4
MSCPSDFLLPCSFGPCKGITRLQRWERAQTLGLSPPPEVPHLVRKHGVDSLFNRDVFSEGKPF